MPQLGGSTTISPTAKVGVVVGRIPHLQHLAFCACVSTRSRSDFCDKIHYYHSVNLYLSSRLKSTLRERSKREGTAHMRYLVNSVIKVGNGPLSQRPPPEV